MLIRRLTIVCLLVAIFGMTFSALVAEAGRIARPSAGAMVACLIERGPSCTPGAGR